MSIKSTLITSLTCLMLSAPAAGTTDHDAIAAAESAQKKAASVGYEWRDTANLIKQAKQLAREGNSAAAIKLASQAEEQGNDAYAQYLYEMQRFDQSR